jgi:hypothetical protein
VVGYQRTAIPGAMMLFEPFPAQGRSGSAIADAAGSRIVGLLYGRSADGPPWYGMATSITAILRGINAATEKTAFRLDPRVAGQAEIEEPQCAGGQCQARGEGRRETGVEDAQCAGGQCYGGQYDPDFFRGRLFGRQAPQPQQPAVPWPNQPPASSVDLAPVVGALQGGFNSMAEAIRGQPPSAPAQGAHDPALLHALQQIGQTAAAADRKADQAIGQVAEVGKKVEAVAGQVDSLHEAIAEGGTLRQRLALKKQELEEEGALEGKGRLGQDLAVLKATLREKHWWVAVVVVIGAVLVVLVAKDIRHKRQTGDPLEIAKLVRRLRGVRKVARAGVGAAAVANPALLPAAAAAGAADKGLDALHRRLDALSAQVNQVALQTPPK